MIINNKELTRRLGMQVTKAYVPKKHRTFVELLHRFIDYIMVSYDKEPQKTVDKINNFMR